MRRTRVRPYSVSARPTRLLSMVMAIAVLWIVYERIKDPVTWQRLLDLKEEPVAAVPAESSVTQQAEHLVEGPNDLDEGQVATAAPMLELVTDKTPLKPREMHAYWRLLAWSRATPFAELRKRALSDVPFTQIWEQPEKLRAKPMALRLHVRRVLKYDAPENPSGVKEMYEAWGWTDESRSFPFVVVFPECPDGLPVGTDVRGEVVFVGYFLKLMSYTAFDTGRGAPLLIGRVQSVGPRPSPPPAKFDPTTVVWVVLIGMSITGCVVWMQFRAGRSNRSKSLPVSLPEEQEISL